MRPPTRDDWGEINTLDLDANWALKQFLGKTFEEAKEMFAENALHYGEDLESMPDVPLNYYALAFAEYICSKHAKDDADGASSFLHRIIWIMKTAPQSFSSDTKVKMLAAAEQVANNQKYYDADMDIYGNFLELLERINSLTN